MTRDELNAALLVERFGAAAIVRDLYSEPATRPVVDGIVPRDPDAWTHLRDLDEATKAVADKGVDAA